MELSQIINTDLRPIPSKFNGNTEHFSKSVLEYTVLSFNDKLFYAKSLDQTKLLKSTDGGIVYNEVWTVPSGIIVAAHLTSNNTIIVFTTITQGTQQGSIYRSTDGISFSKVLDTIAVPLNSKGVTSFGNTVCFGEYTLTNGDAVRIYKSLDNGATWSIALNIGVSSDVGARHFHNCQYVNGLNGFVATTGDVDINLYHSYDAITWTPICLSKNQKRRTLSILSLRRNEMLWSSDSGGGNEGVFTSYLPESRIMSDNDVNTLVKLPKTSYGMAGSGNVIIATTRSTSGYLVDKNVSLFVSIDGGITWQEEGYYPIKYGANDAGYMDIIGPDINGNYYTQLDGIDNISNRSTVKLVPNFHQRNLIIKEKELSQKVDIIPIFNAVAITSTATYTKEIDTSIYKEIMVYVKNSHNQNATLNIDLKSGDRPFIWNGTAFVIDRQISIPGSNSTAAYLLNSRFTWLSKALVNSLRFEFNFATAPTSGDISIVLIGIKK